MDLLTQYSFFVHYPTESNDLSRAHSKSTSFPCDSLTRFLCRMSNLCIFLPDQYVRYQHSLLALFGDQGPTYVHNHKDGSLSVSAPTCTCRVLRHPWWWLSSGLGLTIICGESPHGQLVFGSRFERSASCIPRPTNSHLLLLLPFSSIRPMWSKEI
jgi:hypothetical protein